MFILPRDHLKRYVSKLSCYLILYIYIKIQNGIVSNFDCFLKSPYLKKVHSSFWKI